MSEADFFNAILEKANCGMLLDVNNVYVNSLNHHFDAKDFIRQLPLHRVAQIHMAGHKECGDVIVDTHEGPIIDPVWDLYQFTIQEIGRPVSTLIEWDTNIPALAKVVDEAVHAQRIIDTIIGPQSKVTRPKSPIQSTRDSSVGHGRSMLDPGVYKLAQRREAVGVSR